jgi:hypothetical protein
VEAVAEDEAQAVWGDLGGRLKTLRWEAVDDHDAPAEVQADHRVGGGG